MFFIIVGAGHVGRYILEKILSSGDRAVVVEKKFELCRVLEKRYGVQAINGDATSHDVLRQAGAGKADVLVAATGSDGTNISICKAAKELGIPKVITIANNPANRAEMKKAGADSVICPLESMVAAFERVIRRMDVVTLLHRREDDYKVVKYIISPHSPLVGLRLGHLKPARGANIGLVRRKGRSLLPDPDHTLYAGDELLIQGTVEGVEKTVALLRTLRRQPIEVNCPMEGRLKASLWRVGALLPGPSLFKSLINWIAYVATMVIFRWNFLVGLGKGVQIGSLSEARVYCSNFSEYLFFLHNEESFLKGIFRPEPGQVVIDAGAHQGLWTLYAARRVGIKGLVIAIEPHPSNVKKLLRNLRLNNFSNTIVEQVALGSKEGEVTLHESREIGSHSIVRPVQPTGRKIIVSVQRLDSLLAEKPPVRRIDWIKMDVEGAEYDALVGSVELLRRWRPKLMVEIHGSDNLRRITHLLKSVGYHIQIVRKARCPLWSVRYWLLASPLEEQ